MVSEYLKRICCVNSLLGSYRSSLEKISSSRNKPRQDFALRILSTLEYAEFTNHEVLPSLDEVVSGLIAALPQYLNTVLADSIRVREYLHLSASPIICLDYIGQVLFSSSQIHDPTETTDIPSSSAASCQSYTDESHFFNILLASPNLNIHEPSSESQFEAAIRERTVKYMNLPAEDYTLVLTANEASAFKLVAEWYPFHSNQSLLTMYDHNNKAIESMISISKRRGACSQSATFSWPNLRIRSSRLKKMILTKNKMKNRGLFVFPLHSRITGSEYSYHWMNLARENGWHVLFDACALGPKEMDTLGLALFQPDFLICSFYKIFGHDPTGFCCLFIKKTSNQHLIQTPANMGIIKLVPPPIQTSYQEQDQICEIQNLEKSNREIHCRGLDHADTLGLILISTRLRCLTNWLINALLSLRHPNSGGGIPLVRIFGPKVKLSRGPSMAFNVYDWRGERVDPILVQELASRNNISINCGCLKNICFHENLSQEQKFFEKRSTDEGFGVVSVSLNLMTNVEDVYTFWGFIARFLDADYVEKEKWKHIALNLKTVQFD